MGDETFNTAGDKYVDIITVNTVKKKLIHPCLLLMNARSGQVRLTGIGQWVTRVAKRKDNEMEFILSCLFIGFSVLRLLFMKKGRLINFFCWG